MIHGYDGLTGESFASSQKLLVKMAWWQPAIHWQLRLDLIFLKMEVMRLMQYCSNIALGLMEPTGNGIGGDLFAIVWNAKDKSCMD